MKYTTATRAATRYWADLIWNIASLFGRETVSAVAVAGIFGQGNYYSAKFAWCDAEFGKAGPQNLEKFAMENRGP